MANQAVAILYARLNGLDGVAAERAFVPWVDMAAAMRASCVPLFTLESCAPVSECYLFGLTLPSGLTSPTVLVARVRPGCPQQGQPRK